MTDSTLMGFTMTADPAAIDPAQVLDLLHTTYWAKALEMSMLERSMAHSMSFGLLDGEGRLRGYMRVVTDYTTMYYLADVVVDEALRGQGLGQAFLKFVLADERIATLKNGMLLTRDAQPFYERLGFVRQGERMMLRVTLPQPSSDGINS